MDAAVEARLQIGETAFDEEDAAVLRAVHEWGSLSTAAQRLGRSYSRVHARITELETAVGPLVERQRGGADGGGSHLTSNAWELLGQFVRLRTVVSDTASAKDVVLVGTVVGRDGELATVETAAGRVRAVLFEDADDVEVLFRADAVTLYTPDTAPPAAGTSARNRFQGTVTTIDRREAIADVTIAVESAVQVSVLITRQSLETLALQPGTDVVATFKATATRAIPKEASVAPAE
jgi:molybdate transport system regulatory protein